MPDIYYPFTDRAAYEKAVTALETDQDFLTDRDSYCPVRDRRVHEGYIRRITSVIRPTA
jgi:hypothetical protein